MTDEAGLLALARDHWQIENRLFRVRDGTFAEEACRMRTRSTPQTQPKTRKRGLRAQSKGRNPCRHPIVN
jgi:predicted transposase YbfD/YdcC